MAPSGECLRGDGRCADWIISNLTVVFGGLFARAKPAVGCTWPACQLLYFVAFCLRIIKLMMIGPESKTHSNVRHSQKFTILGTTRGSWGTEVPSRVQDLGRGLGEK